MTDSLDAAERKAHEACPHCQGTLRTCESDYWFDCSWSGHSAIRDLRREAYRQGLRDGRNPSLDEALNSGDGVYRP